MSKEVMNDVTDLQVVDVPTLDGAPLSSKRSLLSPPTYTPLPKTDDERSSYSSDGGGIAFNTNFLKFDAGVLYSVHRKKPIIFLYGMALLVLFASFGCAVVYFLTEIHIDSHKMAISIGPAADLENGIRADFESLSSGTKHLASYVRLSPNCSDIDRDYELHLQEIMRWDDRLTSLEILPSYVLKYRYPLTAIEENVDYLGVSNLDAQYDINTGELWFTVPALYNNSIVGLYACYAIWLPADSYDKDFGCKIQPTNCTTCYNEATGMKYYGTVRSVINMWDWAGGGHDVLKTIREQDLRVNIEVKKWSLESNQYIQSSVYSTEEAPRRKDGIDRVSRVFKVENLIWNIVIEPGSGWAPLWVPYGYLLVCVASVCISLGCTWILIAKFRHETLLQRMLPARVVKHLEKQDGGKVFAESFENVTIFFSDIVNFTVISSELEPSGVVEMLDGMYKLFDHYAHKHGVYKVETIGDAYMAVAGCPTAEDPVVAAMRMARFALDVVDAVKSYKPVCIGDRELQIRVGLHSGPVVAGVVGTQMPRYCLFGDTVNTASRMESNSAADRIHLSADTASLLQSCLKSFSINEFADIGNGACYPESKGKIFVSHDSTRSDERRIYLECRGDTPIKGKGIMRTYWLNSCASQSTTKAYELNPHMNPDFFLKDIENDEFHV